MSLEQYSTEELKEMSLIEIAYELLNNSGKQPYAFKEIMDEITKLLNLSQEEVNTKIAQFYTDLNIDGRFLCLGENRWGLRVWYPVDQTEEETVTTVKPKKKKVKKATDEDLGFDDIEEDDLDFDDLDDFEEVDDEDDDDLLDDEDDDDLLDEDLDDTDDFETDDDLVDDLDDELEEEYDLDEEDLDEEDEEELDDFDDEKDER